MGIIITAIILVIITLMRMIFLSSFLKVILTFNQVKHSTLKHGETSKEKKKDPPPHETKQNKNPGTRNPNPSHPRNQICGSAEAAPIFISFHFFIFFQLLMSFLPLSDHSETLGNSSGVEKLKRANLKYFICDIIPP